jgi:NAD(P)-dependent dehydrogenase (short-subunit alcohol dehydrogenase family)
MSETKAVISSAMDEVLDIIPPAALSAEAQGLAPGRARLEGKRIIVVGGGQAINDFDPNPPIGNGRAISVLLAREGAAVAVVDRSLPAAQATVDLIEQEGIGHAVSILGDVSTPEGCDETIKAALDSLQGVVDGLVIVVGIVGDAGAIEPNTKARAAYWDRTMNLNLRAHYLLMQGLGPLLASRPEGGSIVVIGSVAQVSPASSEPAYHASKAGLAILVKNAAWQFAPHVRVNTVAPGLIDTPIGRRSGLHIKGRNASAVPLARQGTGWDTAYTVAWLLSGESSFITAQDILVDGGRTGTGNKAAKKLDSAFEVS